MAIMQGDKQVANVYNINNNSYAVPVGCIISFSGSTVPTGFLLCDGSEVSKAIYADLYSIVGDTYGTATNTNKFKLPDLRDKFVQGANGNLGVSKEAGLPDINGELGYFAANNAGTWYQGINTYSGAFNSSEPEVGIDPAKPVVQAATSSVNSGEAAVAKFKASDSNSIYGNSATVQPPAVCLNYIIKALKISDIYPNGSGGVTIDAELSDSSTNPVQNKVITNALDNKVDVVNGKGLSANDFTDADKAKLDAITSDKTAAWDDASEKAHEHSNKSVIDKFSESAEGSILYNGSAIGGSGAAIDDTSVTATDKTWSAKKISDTIDTSKVDAYTKSEADDMFAGKDDVHSHSNKATLDKLSETDGGKVTYSGTEIATVSGATLTGALVAQANTDYTVAQVHNVTMSTAAPTGGLNGQIHYKYS